MMSLSATPALLRSCLIAVAAGLAWLLLAPASGIVLRRIGPVARQLAWGPTGSDPARRGSALRATKIPPSASESERR